MSTCHCPFYMVLLLQVFGWQLLLIILYTCVMRHSRYLVSGYDCVCEP